MVTVADTTTGVYILQDNGGWVAANTPNTAVLGGAGLTLGSGYIYFDDFNELVNAKSSPTDADFIGWDIAQRTGTNTQKSQAFCGEAILQTIMLSVVLDSTSAQSLETFYDYVNDKDSAQYYLVRQWGSTTFRQFSYAQTLYKYLPVIITDVMVSETNTGGKFVMSGQISMKVATVVT
jgi:hypothetical protein